MGFSCHIIHAIPGRIRLRVKAIQSSSGPAAAFEHFLRNQPGIAQIRINRRCSCIVLTYDCTLWTPEALVGVIRNLSEAQLTAYGQDSAKTVSPVNVARKSQYELFLSSMTLAVALAGWSFGNVLAPWLLAVSARQIFIRAFDTLRERHKLNVDVLDATATALLVAQGQVSVAAFMVWLVNLADYFRDSTMERTRRAINKILDYQPQCAWVVREDKQAQVAVEQIQPGEIIVVYPGERIPVDGLVISGKAIVDQCILTGDSLPIEKNQGDRVYAGTMLQDGELYLCAEQIGDSTEAAKIIQLIQQAPIRETRVQNYAEQFADRLVPWSFFIAGGSLLATGLAERAASLLVIDYGTGIRVAAPASVLASMTKAAKRGILIKGGRYLEQLARLDTIVFDKTGTLTQGTLDVVEVVPCSKRVSATQVLALAAAAEQYLNHPVAQAVVRAAEAQGLHIAERATLDYTIGLGVEATIDGRQILVGKQSFLTQKGVRLSREAQRHFRRLEEKPASTLCVAMDGSLIGLLALTDSPRPEASQVIRALRARGIKEIILLTGDYSNVAKRVAEDLGISRYIADVFPKEKVEFIKSLQQRGNKVGFVGDGINDAPALAQADVGIAADGGAEVAQESAHIILYHGGLWKLPLVMDISRDGMSLIHQNWGFISISNTVALGLTFFGFLGPIGTTVISNGSAILAAGNALRPLLSDSRPMELR